MTSTELGFYDILQLDPAVSKPMIRAAESSRERRRLAAGMVLRSLLIVATAVAFIGAASALFGADNTPMAVVIFCMVLCLRFVGFGYRIGQALPALAAVFGLLVAVPAIAPQTPAPLLFPLHFAAYLAILVATCRRPEFGNAGLFNFAYIYLVSNPVAGEALLRRSWLAAAGLAICAVVMWRGQRGADAETGVSDVVREFAAGGAGAPWKLRMALGMATALSAGTLLGVERPMWLAFACAALLSTYPYAPVEREKSCDRILGAAVGSVLYVALFAVVPRGASGLLAPLGGFALGLSASYRAKTACNCFGALTLAQASYGVPAAALLRVWDTLLGVALAAAVMLGYHALLRVGARLRRTAAGLVREEGESGPA